MRVPSHSKKLDYMRLTLLNSAENWIVNQKTEKSGIKYSKKCMVRNWKKGFREESNRENRELEIFGW